MPPFQPYPLTASELVLLHGERYAKKVVLGNIKLLQGDISVSVTQLGQALLTSALLACEQEGTVQLQIREKKALLGLAHPKALFIDTGPATMAWPEPSLEARIVLLARQGAANKGRNTVTEVLYTLLAEDSASPWQRLIDMAESYLAARQLLQTEETRTLKVFVTTHYTLPETTLALAQQFPMERVDQMLAACERGRAEIWKRLVAEIRAAMRSRTEKSDSDFDD